MEDIEEFLGDHRDVGGLPFEVGDDPGFGVEVDLAGGECGGVGFFACGSLMGVGRACEIDPPVEFVVGFHRQASAEHLPCSREIFGVELGSVESFCRLSEKSLRSRRS